jgi:hypothetical protein
VSWETVVNGTLCLGAWADGGRLRLRAPSLAGQALAMSFAATYPNVMAGPIVEPAPA